MPRAKAPRFEDVREQRFVVGVGVGDLGSIAVGSERAGRDRRRQWIDDDVGVLIGSYPIAIAISLSFSESVMGEPLTGSSVEPTPETVNRRSPFVVWGKVTSNAPFSVEGLLENDVVGRAGR